VTVTAWQGGGLQVDRLRRIGPALYRTSKPIPVHGDWKALVRVHTGAAVIGAPVYMPADPAIPAAAIPATRSFTRTMERDTQVLQRERDFDVPTWLWGAASAVVMALYLALIAALSWGVGRVGRVRKTPGRTALGRRESRRGAARPLAPTAV
jgi:hypothetical protein